MELFTQPCKVLLLLIFHFTDLKKPEARRTQELALGYTAKKAVRPGFQARSQDSEAHVTNVYFTAAAGLRAPWAQLSNILPIVPVWETMYLKVQRI